MAVQYPNIPLREPAPNPYQIIGQTAMQVGQGVQEFGQERNRLQQAFQQAVQARQDKLMADARANEELRLKQEAAARQAAEAERVANETEARRLRREQLLGTGSPTRTQPQGIETPVNAGAMNVDVQPIQPGTGIPAGDAPRPGVSREQLQAALMAGDITSQEYNALLPEDDNTFGTTTMGQYARLAMSDKPEDRQRAQELLNLVRDYTRASTVSGDIIYDREDAKRFSTLYQDIQAEGRTAANVIDRLNTMQTLASDPRVYTGPLGENVVLTLKGVTDVLGLSNNAASSMEAFNAEAKDLVLETIGGSLGVGFSNADREMIERRLPSLNTTPGGIQKIISIMTAIEERKRDIAELAQDYVEEQGRLDQGFDRMLIRWRRQNPLVVEFGPEGQTRTLQDVLKEDDITSGMGGGESGIVRVKSPEEARRLPAGTVFMTPDGRVKVR